MKIKNSVALVTGANRGVGKFLVEALLEFGAQKVYATARDVSKLPEFNDARVVSLALDVKDEASINRAFMQTQDLTLLINNAGVLSFGDILSVSQAELKHNFDVNFYGVLNTTRGAVSVLEKAAASQAAVVNVLTLLSVASMPGMAAYNAAKAAAWSMTLSLRASLQEKNIAMHSVFPGAIDTDMLAGVEINKTSPADVAAAILDGVENGIEDILPDPMSQQVYSAWLRDPKAVEKQFAAM